MILANCVFRIPRVGDFDKCPTAKFAVAVHGRNPQHLRGGDFGFLVLFLLAGAFQNEIQQIYRAVAVVGHEVAQFLSGDIGALVLVLGGQDGRGGFGFGRHKQFQ